MNTAAVVHHRVGCSRFVDESTVTDAVGFILFVGGVVIGIFKASGGTVGAVDHLFVMGEKGLRPFIGVDAGSAAVGDADRAGELQDLRVTAEQFGGGADTFDHVDLAFVDGGDPVVMTAAESFLTLKHTEKDGGGGFSAGIGCHVAHNS